MYSYQPTANRVGFNVFDQQLLEVLRCPKDQSPLSLAKKNLVQRINRGIEAGRVVNLSGQRLKKHLDTGLVREAGDLLYPVINAIPVMLPDEAVELSQVQDDW